MLCKRESKTVTIFPPSLDFKGMLIGDCGLLSVGTLGDNEKTNLSFGPQDSYEQVKGSTDMW